MQTQVGKLVWWLLCPIAVAVSLYIHDKETNSRFLVNSGTDLSLLLANAAERVSRGLALPLAAANGSPIQSFTQKLVQLQLHGKQFTADFVTANMQ